MKWWRRPAGLSAAIVVAAPVLLLAGCTSDPAPTAVTVGWADKARQSVKVSWKDSGEAPNKILIEGVVTAAPNTVHYVPASAPNTLTLPATTFPPNGNYRVAVSVGTSEGGTTSKAGLSPMFDTDGPARPVVTSVTADPGNNGVVVRWRTQPESEDFTPGDPLDVPREQQLFAGSVGVSGKPMRQLGKPSSATYAVLRNVRPPYRFQLRSTNEWGAIQAGHVNADVAALQTWIPGLAAYGRSSPVRGRVTQQRVVCGGTTCSRQTVTTGGLPIVVQARERNGAPWRGVGRTTTRDSGYFYVTVASPGTRQYRVVAPTTSMGSLALLGSISKPAVTTTKARLIVAGFRGGNVKRRGEGATAYLSIAPAVNGRAMLQFWSGRAWGNTGWVPVRAGVASKTFGATRPGVTGYRWVVPSLVYGGRPVVGVHTGSFVLVTR
jgi:hypothetical protein